MSWIPETAGNFVFGDQWKETITFSFFSFEAGHELLGKAKSQLWGDFAWGTMADITGNSMGGIVLIGTGAGFVSYIRSAVQLGRV